MTALSLSPASAVTPANRDAPGQPGLSRLTPTETAQALRPVEKKRPTTTLPTDEHHDAPAGPAPAFAVSVLQQILSAARDPAPPRAEADAAGGFDAPADPPHRLDHRV